MVATGAQRGFLCGSYKGIQRPGALYFCVLLPAFGLFSSTLCPGTALDSAERLGASFRGAAALSLGLCLPGKGSSWPSGRPSPSDTLPEELSCKSKAQTQSLGIHADLSLNSENYRKHPGKVLKFHRFQNKKIIPI